MEGATCSSCALDGSRESVKCQVRQEACVPIWNIIILKIYFPRCSVAAVCWVHSFAYAEWLG